MSDLEQVMKKGMQWSEENGYSWPEDRDFVEENGCFKNAMPSKVFYLFKAFKLRELIKR